MIYPVFTELEEVLEYFENTDECPNSEEPRRRAGVRAPEEVAAFFMQSNYSVLKKTPGTEKRLFFQIKKMGFGVCTIKFRPENLHNTVVVTDWDSVRDSVGFPVST